MWDCSTPCLPDLLASSFLTICMGSNFANIVIRLFKIGIRRNCVQVLPCGGDYPMLIATLIVIHNSIAIAS